MRRLRMAKQNGGEKIEGGSTYARHLARRTKNTFKPVGDALITKSWTTVAPMIVQLVQQYLMKGGSTYAQRLARRTRNALKPVGRAFQQLGNELRLIVAPIVKQAGQALMDRA